MGKLIKMQGVSGHTITPEMRNKKSANQSISGNVSFLGILGWVLLSPLYLIALTYRLFIKFPQYRSFGSHFIGLLRFCLYLYLFWYVDHKQLFKDFFDSQQWQLSWPFFTLFTGIMTLISFFVFLGVSKDGLDTAPINHRQEESDFDFTIRQMNWRLSNRTERNKFIDNFFK